MTSHPHRLSVVAAAALLLSSAALSAQSPPNPETVLQRLLAAAGGQEALGKIGMLELQLVDQETKADGTTSTASSRVFVAGAAVESIRVEKPGGLVLVRRGDASWATLGGQLDTRPQTPIRATGEVNKRAFSALLPFSLAHDGVTLGQPVATRFEGKPAWSLPVTLPRNFFANPILDSTWNLLVARDDLSLLCLELRPPLEYANAGATGLRYRVLKTERVEGVRVPTEVLAESVDVEGVPTGSHRVTRVTPTAHARWDPTLFIDPETLARIEGD